jgi:hypothetical protein
MVPHLIVVEPPVLMPQTVQVFQKVSHIVKRLGKRFGEDKSIVVCRVRNM